MKYLVTLSDIKYIDKGLVLFDSLESTSNIDFKLYYLCLDDKTYNIIQNINNPKLIPYHANNIIEDDEFKILMKSSKSIDDNMKGRPDYVSTYHYASAPYITYHLMKKFDLPELIYIDSDIKFYGDFNIAKILSVSLFGTITSSILTGLTIPYVFVKLRFDPANASGPVGTVIQDFLSVLIYFTIASLLI